MELKRLRAGEYASNDGRVLIKREVSRQICWSVTIDGKILAFHHTKRDALDEARRLIDRATYYVATYADGGVEVADSCPFGWTRAGET
jgi:hypothetical protein